MRARRCRFLKIQLNSLGNDVRTKAVSLKLPTYNCTNDFLIIFSNIFISFFICPKPKFTTLQVSLVAFVGFKHYAYSSVQCSSQFDFTFFEYSIRSPMEKFLWYVLRKFPTPTENMSLKTWISKEFYSVLHFSNCSIAWLHLSCRSR